MEKIRLFKTDYEKILRSSTLEAWERFPDNTDLHAAMRFTFVNRMLQLESAQRAERQKIIFWIAQLIAFTLILISIFLL